MKHWSVERTDQGGTIRHDSPPFFTARWTTGGDPAEISAIEGPCFTDEGSGTGEDAVHIYGFQWAAQAPERSEFERLMLEAVREIDNFIARSF